jgi:Fic family protein
MVLYGCIFGDMIRSATLQVTPDILRLIARIDEFKGAWRALGTLPPDRLSSLRRVATIESIGSSTRIEGSTLSDDQVERLLATLTAQAFDTRDAQEVAGYAEAMSVVLASWREIPFDENHVAQLHQILLRHSEKDARHRGRYKSTPNHIGAFDADGVAVGIVLETASPFDTPRRMEELVDWVRAARAEDALHPLVIIAIAIVVFLEIHPFQDGNGRLSRILTTLLLLQAGYAYVPYRSLERVIEREKEAYYLALRQTQRTIRSEAPDWQPWLTFFLRSLAEQARGLEAMVEEERRLRDVLPDLSRRIVDFACAHGRITIGDAIRLTGVSRNTLKPHFKTLVQEGRLRQLGRGKGTWYTV